MHEILLSLDVKNVFAGLIADDIMHCLMVVIAHHKFRGSKTGSKQKKHFFDMCIAKLKL